MISAARVWPVSPVRIAFRAIRLTVPPRRANQQRLRKFLNRSGEGVTVGAGNVGRVYRGWRPRLKDRPFTLFAYMALVARDHDKEPWCGLRHEDLAEWALGLSVPEKAPNRDRVLRIVRRHITPLFAAGAIETTRRATTGTLGVKAVVYRLYLDGPWLSSPFPEPMPGGLVVSPDELIADEARARAIRA